MRIGNKVKLIDNNGLQIPIGREGIIMSQVLWYGSVYYNYVDFGYGSHQAVLEKQLSLVDELNKRQETKMNIKEQFLLAITAEPQKSFRKAGITNGDDLLTDDGQKVFMSWLLKQNQDVFKKEVVDPILADLEKEKK